MSTKATEKLASLKKSNQERIGNLRKEIKAWILNSLCDMTEIERKYFERYFLTEEKEGVETFYILNKKGTSRINVDVASVYDLGFFYKKIESFDEIIEMFEAAKAEKQVDLYLNSLGF